MKFLGKSGLMAISKVTKKQGFTLSLEDTFLEKPQRGSICLPAPASLGLSPVGNRVGNHCRQVMLVIIVDNIVMDKYYFFDL